MKRPPKRSSREAISHFFRSLIQIGRIAFDAAPFSLIATVLVRLSQVVFNLANAYVLKLIFDQLGLVISGETEANFFESGATLIAVYAFVLIASQILPSLNTYLSEELGRRLQIHTSKLVYGHLISLQGLYYFETPRFHDTFRQATGNLQWLPVQIITETSGLIGNVLTVIGFLGVVFFFNPLIAMLLILATIPTFIAQLRFRRKRYDLSWDYSPKDRKAHYLASLLSAESYVKEVRLFNLGDYFLKRYLDTNLDTHAARRKLTQEELRVNSSLSMFSALITVISYVYAISQAFARQISLGDMTLYIEALRNVQFNLNTLAWLSVSLSERALFFTHYQDLMAMESDLAIHSPQKAVENLTEGIELRNVSFRYTEESDYVLRNINLQIRKGESLALVGLNGAGKTTLVKLLARFYDPTEGEILWDGVDIRHFAPQDLREHLGAVLQDFVRYDLTARENIGLGNLEYLDDLPKIEEVAQAMGVDKFIKELPQGYETVLSRWLLEDNEEGTNLSGGQWQKIAIARAYLRDVDVLLLDEPTAALDAEAEHEIYGNFAELAKNRATLLISHRFSTVRMADKIAVIEDACIKEYGSHQDLMRQNGTYAHLYQLQASQYHKE